MYSPLWNLVAKRLKVSTIFDQLTSNFGRTNSGPFSKHWGGGAPPHGSTPAYNNDIQINHVKRDYYQSLNRFVVKKWYKSGCLNLHDKIRLHLNWKFHRFLNFWLRTSQVKQQKNPIWLNPNPYVSISNLKKCSSNFEWTHQPLAYFVIFFNGKLGGNFSIDTIIKT